jgi:spermidine synthase
VTIVARHLVVDAFGCSAAALDDVNLLSHLLTEAAKRVGVQVLHSYFHRFQPQGVTGAMVISTSHLAIHTWPENRYAAFDIFTCGEGDVRAAAESVLECLGAERSVVKELVRGQDMAVTEPAPENPFAVIRGDWWDQVELKEILAGPHRIVCRGSSPYQEVLLVQSPDVRLYLDQQLQFSSLDERCYHEALVHPMMTIAPARGRVLVLGGGDALAVREVLKYSDVQHVDLVEIDPLVVSLATELPEILVLNEGALADPRVQVHVQDAAEFVAMQHPPYDVIIIDFPDPADEVISRLYTQELFQQVAQHLTPDGLLVCQSYSPEEAPMVFWSIGRTLEAAGLQILSYHEELHSFGDWGFHMGGFTAPVWRGERVTVPYRTLPEDLTRWFSFEEEVAEVQPMVEANSLERLILHEYYHDEVGIGESSGEEETDGTEIAMDSTGVEVGSTEVGLDCSHQPDA